MKKATFILAALTFALSFNSCNRKGCIDPLASNYNEKSKKDDGKCTYDTQTINFNFTQNFNGVAITQSEFNQLAYTNANGEVLSLTKLQYSISDIRFYLDNGDSILVDGSYHFVDLEDAATLTYTLPAISDYISETQDYKASFTGIGFNYGFDAEDNVSGAYADLNLVSWAWPDMIGGGYHQMKMEGRYINSATDTVSFQYHNGSATKNAAGDFESNYRFIQLDNSDFFLTAPTTIEIKMNIANWFQTPITWDLNTAYTMLMPNYAAQIMMSQNAGDVFSVGTISQ
jgi:hypothetical protein